ncbi:MAG TPA: NUDIX domain-containing protein [Streptosporangiaceae bacterium]|nr:NUDIX domain-containing protein [Streptosporangiaceae bacterium]
MSRPLADLLSAYQPHDAAEAADLPRIRAIAGAAADPWSRSSPLHLTGSAVIVHPATGRVLLRWHERQGAWLQVGGHGDPGESDPLQITLREAREETGLADLVPWPDPALVHAVIVSVPARGDEPAHEHADLRFVLATSDPAAARPEHESAPLRWLTMDEARAVTAEDNLRETLDRVARLLPAAQQAQRGIPAG